MKVWIDGNLVGETAGEVRIVRKQEDTMSADMGIFEQAMESSAEALTDFVSKNFDALVLTLGQGDLHIGVSTKGNEDKPMVFKLSMSVGE